MKLDEILAAAMVSQFNYERYSADVYYALANQLDFLNLTGFKSYMLKRASEERSHAQKFADYLADRNVVPVVDALPKPATEIGIDVFIAGKNAFQAALDHEKTVTSRINALCILAENDPASIELLLWFAKEQVEEERTLEEVMTKFALIGSNGTGIYILDKELGE